MKLLQIVPREGTRLYGAIMKKQAEIRRGGRGTFSRGKARKRKAARWTHVRYKGSVNLEPGLSEAVEVAISSPERGDEARLLFVISRLARPPFRRASVIHQHSVSTRRACPSSLTQT
jgi:hypothetical protein